MRRLQTEREDASDGILFFCLIFLPLTSDFLPFGSVSKYINSDTFREARIENSFGECNVFFNNTILASANAHIKADNSFGSMNIYLPSTWRVVTRQDTAFGNIKFRGHGSNEEGSPAIELILNCSFGEINIIFE